MALLIRANLMLQIALLEIEILNSSKIISVLEDME